MVKKRFPKLEQIHKEKNEKFQKEQDEIIERLQQEHALIIMMHLFPEEFKEKADFEGKVKAIQNRLKNHQYNFLHQLPIIEYIMCIDFNE